MFKHHIKGQKKDAQRIDKARDDKCIPLAKAYLQNILDADVSLDGNLKPEELRKEYEPIMLKMLDLYLEKDVTMIEAGYIRKLIDEMINNVENLLVESVNNSLRIAEKKLFGCDKQDMSFNVLDDILKDKK